MMEMLTTICQVEKFFPSISNEESKKYSWGKNQQVTGIQKSAYLTPEQTEESQQNCHKGEDSLFGLETQHTQHSWSSKLKRHTGIDTHKQGDIQRRRNRKKAEWPL